jgi:hypothetical protein
MENTLLRKRAVELERENERLRAQHGLAKKNEYRSTGFALIFLGALTLAISYFTYNNTKLASILLFAGLGTTYLGIISLFLSPERFVREELMEKSILSSIIVINNIIQELQIYSKGIYILADNEIKVILPLRADYEVPKEISQRTFQVGEPSSMALVLSPLGYSLMQMAEKKGADWSDLTQALNDVLVEGLELAHSVEVIQDRDITVKVNEPVYINLCDKVSTEAPQICDIGCSFCSLIACIVTKSTGKKIVIEQVEHSKNSIVARFSLS